MSLASETSAEGESKSSGVLRDFLTLPPDSSQARSAWSATDWEGTPTGLALATIEDEWRPYCAIGAITGRTAVFGPSSSELLPSGAEVVFEMV